MSSNDKATKSLQELREERSIITTLMLLEQFKDNQRPLSYVIAVISAEATRGNLGDLPPSLRAQAKSLLWHHTRRFQQTHNRAPNIAELIGFIA